MQNSDPQAPKGKTKVVVVEGPPAKNIAGLNYLGYHTNRVGIRATMTEDGSIQSAVAADQMAELESSSSCESSWLIGCCIIHPL